MRNYFVSAPGKILLLGGYSVLEKGNVSFVAAIDKRVYASIQLIGMEEVLFSIPQFGIFFEGEIAREGLRFSASKDERQSARFVINAVEMTLRYLSAKGGKITGFKLTAMNDAAFGTAGRKTGLGSSAAVTVAVIGALLTAYGYDLRNSKTKQIIHNLSQLSHSVSQGKIGSGFDVASAVYGSIKYGRCSPSIIQKALKVKGKAFAKQIESNWGYSVFPLILPSEFLPIAAYTRYSAPTPQMVKRVMGYKGREAKTYNELIEEINRANIDALKALEEIVLQKARSKEYRKRLRERKGEFEQFQAHFNDGRLLTKKLGELAKTDIESSKFTRLIQLSLQKGAYVCKLPGAGGGDSIVAVCLSEEERRKLSRYWRSLKLGVLSIGFSEEGVRVETEKAIS